MTSLLTKMNTLMLLAVEDFVIALFQRCFDWLSQQYFPLQIFIIVVSLYSTAQSGAKSFGVIPMKLRLRSKLKEQQLLVKCVK